MLKISLISVLMLGSLQVFAEKPMDNAITAMCDNLKKCTIEHLGKKQKINDKEKSLIITAFDKKCDSMKSHYHHYIEHNPDIHDDAVTCIQRLSKASCDDLLNDKENANCLIFTKDK
ncbi:hypothetical protein PMAL9190_00132 [Photobacterium malacitanum]|uniref:DUF19 domain-containing protein n=1 Tax=Photobacterium malacitanum TaxID=2204294 RepID=A0A1Y6M503_9GAMM|nr:hypothetical protein [Photobacterium malacitanum]SMY31662.1 hypothetical protein PMAL9190_00132 [Photobacterium malacitanum]